MAQKMLEPEPETEVCLKGHGIVCEDCPFFEDCLLGRRRMCEWRDNF